MAETSTKIAFKKYLQQKKQATKNLSKLEQNEINRLEEQKILKRVKTRERYATDEEFREKQKACAKKTMKKVRLTKKQDVENLSDLPDDNEIEVVDYPPSPEPAKEQPTKSYSNIFGVGHRQLF